MYLANPDFVFTVTRDFVRACQTPILVLPDDVPPHPYEVAMEVAMLAPNSQVSIYPGRTRRRRSRWRCATSARSSRPTGRRRQRWNNAQRPTELTAAVRS